MPNTQSRKGISDKFFYSILAVCGFVFIGFLGTILKNLEGTPSLAPPAVVVVEAKPDTGLTSEPYKIDRPSEPYATYLVHRVVKEGGSIVSAINSRQSDQTGVWYTHRRYDCAKGKLFTVGDAETMEGIAGSKSDIRWSGLVEGSSATQVARYACSVAGMELHNTD